MLNIGITYNYNVPMIFVVVSTCLLSATILTINVALCVGSRNKALLAIKLSRVDGTHRVVFGIYKQSGSR